MSCHVPKNRKTGKRSAATVGYGQGKIVSVLPPPRRGIRARLSSGGSVETSHGWGRGALLSCYAAPLLLLK
eukprot:scaffold144111_cov24-Tisochrysis_lutea.AAC.1